MALSISHGAFDASYSAFNRFRRHILRSIRGSFPPHDKKLVEDNNLQSDLWYWYIDENGKMPFNRNTHPGLYELFSHSDCSGEISPEKCKLLADELESILFHIKHLELNEPCSGQILNRGGYTQMTKDFIKGCRLAHQRNEPLEFL